MNDKKSACGFVLLIRKQIEYVHSVESNSIQTQASWFIEADLSSCLVFCSDSVELRNLAAAPAHETLSVPE